MSLILILPPLSAEVWRVALEVKGGPVDGLLFREFK